MRLHAFLQLSFVSLATTVSTTRAQFHWHINAGAGGREFSRKLRVMFFCAAVIAVSLCSSTSLAINLVYEPFSYTAPEALIGKVNTSAGTEANGSTWMRASATATTTTINTATGNLTGPSALPTSAGNSLAITGIGNNVDGANRLLLNELLTSGTVYYSFSLRVDELTGSNNTTGGYFLALNNAATINQTTDPTIALGRVYSRIDPTDPTKYNLGIFTNVASTAGAGPWSGPLTVGDTQFIVGAIDFTTTTHNAARMWINPAAETFNQPAAPTESLSNTTASTINTGIQSVLVRQSPSTHVTMDELRVATTWAEVTPPSTPELYWDIDGATAGAGGGTTPNGTWDATANWNSSPGGDSAAQAWIADAKAVFSAGTSASGIYTVTLDGPQSASKLTFKDGAATLTGGTLNLPTNPGLSTSIDTNTGVTATIASVVAGMNSLKKEGAGTLVLSGANTYSGGTNLGGGVLEVSTNANLGDAAGSITFSAPATLRMASSISNARNVAVIAASTVDTPASTDSTLNGVISGTSNLTKSGDGTLRLGAANTFSGTTRATAGTLQLAHSQALQNSTLDMNGADTGTVVFDTSISSVTLGGLSGSRNLVLENAAPAPIALSIGNSITGLSSTTPPATYSGSLSSGTGVTKIGTSRQVLTGVNTYSGGTTINAGILQFGKTNSMPSSGDVTVNSGGTLAVNVGGGGEWTGGTSGGGSIGGLIAGIGGGGPGTPDQVAWTDGSNLGIDTTSVGLLAYGGVIGNFRTTSGTTNAVGLTKLGAGTLELTGTNTYTGTTTIGRGVDPANRSVLFVSSSDAIPENGVINFAGGNSPENRLEIATGVNVTVSAITGGGLQGALTAESASRIVIGFGTLTFDVPSGQTATVAPFISADFNPGTDARGQLVKDGAGTLDLLRNNGTSNFKGEVVLNEGTLNLVQGQSFGGAAEDSKLTINGGKLAYAGDGGNLTMQTQFLDINDDFTLENTANGSVTQFYGAAGSAIIKLTTDATITVNAPLGGNFVFGGKVVDDGTPQGFTKDGDGLLTLQNKYNSYRGDTTILAGTLSLGFGSNLVDEEGHPGDPPGSASPGNFGNGDGAVHLSGGTLNFSRGRSLNPADNEFVKNPLNLTADSEITNSNNAAGLSPANVNFSSNSIGGTGGTLTLRNDAAAGGNNPGNHPFHVYFSGNGFNFSRPINFEPGVNSLRPTQLVSANTSGTQTWSGAITGEGSFRRSILPGDTPGTGGTTVFTGANTYSLGTFVEDGTLAASGLSANFGTGNVTVNGGLLEIMAGVGNAIANSATLSVLTAGQVILGNGINEIIAGLTLDGNPFGLGTYGSSTSGAANTGLANPNDYFSGMGILTVSTPGDYNEDGIVDAADYVVWRKNPLGFPANAYEIWRQNFGNPSGAGSGAGIDGGAVPEPCALVLVGISILMAGAYGRRRLSRDSLTGRLAGTV